MKVLIQLFSSSHNVTHASAAQNEPISTPREVSQLAGSRDYPGGMASKLRRATTGGPSGRSKSWRPVGLYLLGFLLCAGLFILMLLVAHRDVAGNSDGATVILEGQAIAHGNLSLSGWTLSLDSFWTMDALFYAAGVGVVGISPVLLTAIPALLATLTLAAVALLAGTGMQRRTAIVSGIIAWAVLLPQSRAFASFFLQGPLHVETTLVCLLSFFLFRRDRFDLAWALAVLLLVLGLLGDFETFALGVAPVFGAGIAMMAATLNWRRGLAIVAGSVTSVIGYLVMREVMRTVGGFDLAKANPVASGHQIIHNIANIPSYILGLLGLSSGPYGISTIPIGLRIAHFLILAAFAYGSVLVLVRLVKVLLKPVDAIADARSFNFDNMLLLGVIADFATFVFFPIINSSAYGRYFTPGIVYGSLLVGRACAQLVTGERPSWMRVEWMRRSAVVLASVIVCLACLTFGFELRGPNAAQPVTALAEFLESHHLRSGIGAYWSSSVTTVESSGNVVVRPVIADAQGKLVRYEKQSAATWYSKVPFQFFVYNTADVWDNTDAQVAISTYGPALHTYAVDTYRVLVWRKPITVSPVGSAGP